MDHTLDHVMIDLETLGTRPGAVILSAAALFFDPHSSELGESKTWGIYVSDRDGLHVEIDAVRFWAAQPDEARHAALLSAVTPINSFLLEMNSFIGRARSPRPRIWAHGSSFDPVMLAAASYQASIAMPNLDFRKLRDTRTVFDMAGIADLKPFATPEDIAHQPLSDCRIQARAVSEGYRILGLATPAASKAEG